MNLAFATDIPHFVKKNVFNKYTEMFDVVCYPDEAEVLVVAVNPVDLRVLPRVKYVVCPATNTDHIKGITNQTIISLKNQTDFIKQITATAEHTICLMLMLARKTYITSRTWNRWNYMGKRLAGSTLGIIGNGRVGQQVGEIALGLKMQVLAYDTIQSRSNATKDQVLKASDFISIHVSVNESSSPIISEEEIKKIKDGACLINTTRGCVLDEDLLIRYSNKFHGIALDVLQGEPSPQRIQALGSLDNVLITPHIAGCTYQDMSKAADHCLEVLMGEVYDSTAE